ncbi:transporter [Flavobacterium sp. '19STA2R22 D10 B1']|uniref:transporter n=1 Tax=Flavobacterium aerium TaxID=3037261 RepID=UPI00278C5271|nr:transporter [Flavobacterium sp. '19STA2R22 D10 B1']
MKTKIIVLVLAVQFTFSAWAHEIKDPVTRFTYQRMMLEEDDCDACGCSANGGGMSFSSMLNNNFVGVRYFHQSYSSRDGIFKNSPWIDENFNTMQVWARVPVAKNIQIMALVPYHFHNSEKTAGDQTINGIGDITVLGLYNVFQTKSDSAAVRHQVQLGGGVKAPTGKYDRANNGSVNPSFQVGTGAWDFLLVSEYVIRKDNFGLNTMLNYTIKTENKQHYQFGNQLNYGSTLFYTFSNTKYTWVPQIGVAGEVYETNRSYGEDLKNTSGDIFFGKLGVEVGLDKFSVGLNAMLPINQNLTGGLVEANYRFAVNLNYNL